MKDTENLPFTPKSMGRKDFEVTITPHVAEVLLSEKYYPKDKQRKLREGVAERYGMEMKAGAWRRTNQGIAFDRNGHLIDGQHRLWGCIDSHSEFTTLVTVGLDPDAAEYIDTGIPRSLADRHLFHTGEKVSPLFGAVARAMFDRGLGKRPLDSIMIDFMKRHQEAIQFASGMPATDVQGVRKASVLAPIARAYYYEDHEQLRAFMSVLGTGMSDSRFQNGSGSVIKLRNMLIADWGKRGRQTAGSSTLFAKASRTLRAFLDDQLLANIYATDHDYWPIKETAAERKARKNAK